MKEASYTFLPIYVRMMPNYISGKNTEKITKLFSDGMSCPGVSTYCASKGALNQYAKCIALEEAKHGIRVNVVCPGATQSEMLDKIKNCVSKEKWEYWVKVMNPFSRVGTSEGVARIIAFVASDGNGFMTGTAIVTIQ